MSTNTTRATSPEPDGGGAIRARLGLRLFVVYLVLYVGFMALNVFDPMAMGRSFGPTNVAITYGLFLIVSALVLAVIYMRVAGRTP
ncbi:MAG: DUF485 domain-containing protein [Vicinamibacterales bacterium]